MAAVDLVAIKTAFEGLEYKDAVDPDALLEKVKEKRGELPEGGATSEFLRSIFKDMGIETVIEAPAPAEGEGEGEGGGEGGDGGDGDAKAADGDDSSAGPSPSDEEGAAAEAKGAGEGEGGEDAKDAEPAAPPEPEWTNKAASLFALVDTNGSGAVNISDLLSIICLIQRGYGQGALEYCAKAFDLGDQGSLNEEELFSAIRWCASGELTPLLMNHLRRLWRQVAKTGAREATRANTEDFFEKLGGDEFLAAVLLTDKVIEAPQPEGEGEEGDGGESD